MSCWQPGCKTLKGIALPLLGQETSLCTVLLRNTQNLSPFSTPTPGPSTITSQVSTGLPASTCPENWSELLKMSTCFLYPTPDSGLLGTLSIKISPPHHTHKVQKEVVPKDGTQTGTTERSLLAAQEGKSPLLTPQTLITTRSCHGKGRARGLGDQGLEGGRDCKAFT